MPGTDRASLEALADTFLEALAARDPARAALAPQVRYTEDGQELEIGDGLWGTADGLGSYRALIVDPDTGQVGMFATLRENGAPVILVARIKAVAGALTEIEAIVARGGFGPMANGAELLEKLDGPSPLWSQPVPPAERLSREALIAAADKYFWGLEKNAPGRDYSFFADDCVRLENGMATTGNKDLRYGEGISERPIDDFMAAFAGMGAREQFETGYFCFVDRIRDRRFPVVDVETGSVFTFVFFDHSGTIHRIPLADGRTIDGGVREPYTWELGEAFKIDKGKIAFVEAVMKRCPYGMKPNWPA